MKEEKNTDTIPITKNTNQRPCPLGGKGRGKGLYLILERTYLAEGYTLGKMNILAKPEGSDKRKYFQFCDTLEPQVRKEGEYVLGQTAIPEGEYKIGIDYDARTQTNTLTLRGVKGFPHITIAKGHSKRQTQGSILVGRCWLPEHGLLVSSDEIFRKLDHMVRAEILKGNEVWIKIRHRSVWEYYHGLQKQLNNETTKSLNNEDNHYGNKEIYNEANKELEEIERNAIG